MPAPAPRPIFPRTKRTEVSGITNIATFLGRRIGPWAPHTAGAKRLALLCEVTIAAGLRGTRVLQAAREDELAGTRLADGMLRITPGLCDALIELMANLPIALVPVDGGGHAA